MALAIHTLCDRWQEPGAPMPEVVVSSRCRLARNLAGLPFSRHADREQCDEIRDRILTAVREEPTLADFRHMPLADLEPTERALLRESHLISAEFERQVESGSVLISGDGHISLMVNEEDHLRMMAIEPGHRVRETHRRIDEVDDRLAHRLALAFSSRLGHLTACPTNTGTGLRASVMLHLPGLVLGGKADRMMKEIAGHDFAVRGFYGEGSNTAGDLFQISNEVTLGRDEGRILDDLLGVIDQVIEREREARELLTQERRIFMEDAVWRSLATLCHARIMNSTEAIALLSRLRLGLGMDILDGALTHEDLNRLLIQIQPAHLMSRFDLEDESEARDIARATFLRETLQGLGA